MNISGTVSIKTATIGGKANGSYVDSDKFKASDVNFHLQVKVTNQTHEAPEYCIFNKIDKVDKSQFPEVYGVRSLIFGAWRESLRLTLFPGLFYLGLGGRRRAQRCHLDEGARQVQDL